VKREPQKQTNSSPYWRWMLPFIAWNHRRAGRAFWLVGDVAGSAPGWDGWFGWVWILVLWATASNAFSPPRPHPIGPHGANRRPYQFVRHPGYVGAILYQLATPFCWVVVGIHPCDSLSTRFWPCAPALEDKMLQQKFGRPSCVRPGCALPSVTGCG